MRLSELKKVCEEKCMEVQKLYKEMSEDIILKDINEYMSGTVHTIKKTSIGYVLDEKVYLSILDGNLDIIDRRATAFGWTFEIQCNIVNNDSFEYKGKFHSVKFVSDENLCPEVEKVIESLDESLNRLKKKEVVEYQYYSAHEDIEVSSFEKVIETVLQREPRVC